MSDLTASVLETKNGFHVDGYEKISYDFTFLDGVFDIKNRQLAECYQKWGRVLAVTDMNVFDTYGEQIERYFEHYKLDLKVHKTKIGEKAKTIPTFLSIVDSMTEFGIYRKVLAILFVSPSTFACAAYRRNTNFIRVPTTVIGLIDASVSIKVAVNYGNYKNRLGAYHAPMHTFLDFTFLRTLPVAQIRNGFAELIKISSCSHLPTFDLLDRYCEQIIDTAFGRLEGAPEEVRAAADKINRDGILEMLRLETPNLHEIGLDRVIAYGHTWSPMHELVPETPLRHGHAISIDMAYSATLANNRGLLSDKEHRRLLSLFSRAGLSMDHPQFDEEILDKGTKAILKTRDGKLRAAVPNPLGSCTFLNDVSPEELNEALRRHKALMKDYPRNGEGLEAFVDASDTGYTENNQKEVDALEAAATKAGSLNGSMNGNSVVHGGKVVNGHANGMNGHVDGVAEKLANGSAKGLTNGVNGFTNGAKA
ncbi:MAG: hypothetical protein Q9219_005677 [cf. Caloplaca sp. 3 TL-2023]